MMTIQDIGRWAEFGRALFAQNLRFHVGETSVNYALDQTIQKEAANFWYYNNGITILCDTVEKTHHNASNRDYGLFKCAGMSVVNGAQTVGVIAQRALSDPRGFAEAKARVSVRLISLENCPPDFANAVARATNTQNRIQPINFIAFDENQSRLAIEMEGIGKIYTYKEGDRILFNSEGCGAEEAAVALACASSDMSMAVLAKREVGRLWASTSEKPYTALFNQSLSATKMWRAVRILRAVSNSLDSLNVTDYPRGELVAIHGNRFVLHVVFQDPLIQNFHDPVADEHDLLQKVTEITPAVFRRLTTLVSAHYADNYLANLFKNSEKCEALGRLMREVQLFPEHLFRSEHESIQPQDGERAASG